jgi:hypothetical protein
MFKLQCRDREKRSRPKLLKLNQPQGKLPLIDGQADCESAHRRAKENKRSINIDLNI